MQLKLYTHAAPTLEPWAGDGRFIASLQLKAIPPWTHIIHFNTGTFTKEKMLSEECSRGLGLLSESQCGVLHSRYHFIFVLGINEHTVPLIQ